MLRLVDSPSARLPVALRAGETALAECLVTRALEDGETAVEVLNHLAAALRDTRSSEAEAHRATIVCEHLLAVTFEALREPAPASAALVIVAGAPGESRALGLRLAACVAESAGCDVRNLGSALDPFALARRIADERPGAVVLCAQEAASLPRLQRAIAAVRVAAPSADAIVYGEAAAGRSSVLGATVAKDLNELARLLPRHTVTAA